MKKILLISLAVLLIVVNSGALAQKATGDALREALETARKKVYPALVNITVVVRYYAQGRAQRSASGGSGVIVTPEGHVLTNYHVAGNTTRITCTLTTGEAMEASVVVHDPLTDLSVLKLNTSRRADPKAPLPYARLGDSDALQVGDSVMAMGNPLMLTSSVTLGIVSNTKRVFTDFIGTELEEQELDYGEKTGLLTRWIQHDALILPGNSGGPLVNVRGEVVGINELGGSGMGFAIPSNIAKQVLKQALEKGKVVRGWLGITVLPVEKMGLKRGALVSAVAPGSPAAKAGLAPGDILLSINDAPTDVRFFEEVPLVAQQIAALPVGEKARLQFERQGKTQVVEATIAPMEKFLGEEEEVREMGATVQEITGPMALQRRLPATEGVLLTGMRPGYPFESAQPKLQEGDVIVSVDGKPTPNLAAFRKVLEEVGEEKREISIGCKRGDESIVTVVKMPEEKASGAGGELPKAWLGVKTQVLTPEVAKALNIPNVKGFRITQVYAGTEANKAGLQVGDIITAFNGSKLNASRPQDADDLRQMVENLSIGEKAEIALLREGKPMKITVTMQETPASSEDAKKATQKEFEFTVREIVAMDRMENRWLRGKKGLLVSEVTAGGWAYMAGLRVDDVIASINGIPIDSIDTFEKVSAQALKERPKILKVFVHRGAQTHFVFIEPDWAKVTATK